MSKSTEALQQPGSCVTAFPPGPEGREVWCRAGGSVLDNVLPLERGINTRKEYGGDCIKGGEKNNTESKETQTHCKDVPESSHRVVSRIC